MESIDASLLAIGFAIFVFAGTVKGALAIGLPTVSVVFLAMIVDVRLAISLMLFPLFFSNLYLAVRGGNYLRTLHRYRYFIAVQSITIVIVSILTSDFESEQLRVVLGWGVIIFAITGLMNVFPIVDEKLDRFLQVGLGLLAGFLGGTIAVWAPAVVIYLSMRGIQREEFARASGMIITVGAIPLLLMHAYLGHLDVANASLSLLALIPVYLGLVVGEWIREKISEKIFRRSLLILFLLLGMNMVL